MAVKVLLNNKLTECPKSNENKNEWKNKGYYSIKRKHRYYRVKSQMSNLNV